MTLVRAAGKRLLIECILIGLAFLLLCSSTPIWSQEPRGMPVNLDVILLIDNSQSMAEISDSDKLRIQAARLLVDRLSDNAETFNVRHRVGVVSFGFRVTDITPLTELPSNIVRDSIHAESIPGSDFREPLGVALQQFQDYSFGTGNRKAVILFTDGRPQLTETPLTEEDLQAYFSDKAEEVLRDGKGNLSDVIHKLRAEDVQIFVVAIGDEKEDKDNWTRLIPEDHYIPIESMTQSERLQDIVSRLTMVSLTPSPTVPTPTVQPTLTPTSTATPTPTPIVVGPVVTPTTTSTPPATPAPRGTAAPWGLPGTMIILGLAGAGMAIWVLRRAGQWQREKVKWNTEREKWERKEASWNKERKEWDKERGEQRWREQRWRAKEQGWRDKEQTYKEIEEELKQAEKDLEEGRKDKARELGEKVLRDASQYAGGVLITTTEYVAKALDIIRRATDDREAWANTVYKYLQDDSIVTQHGLASALKSWWANHPNEAVEGIYDLMSKDGQGILKLIAVGEVNWPEETLEIVKSNAKMVEDICTSLHNLLTREDDENLASILNKVADVFGAASDAFAHAGDAQSLYRCMAQLAEHPLWPVEFPALSEGSLPYLRNVAEFLKQGFTLPSPVWEGLPQLNQLKQEKLTC